MKSSGAILSKRAMNMHFKQLTMAFPHLSQLNSHLKMRILSEFINPKNIVEHDRMAIIFKIYTN